MCPANPAPQGEQQQQEPSSDGQSQYSEPLKSCIGAPRLADLKLKGVPLLPPSPMDRLIAALESQNKAIEEYTKATANLTIHIGLLIQAMAEDQDDGDGMPSVRTLG